jgi:imidazolonepropionase-like amidohydrolase
MSKIFLIFVFGLVVISTAPAENILLKDAQIIQPDTRTVSSQKSLWIKNGRIFKILDKAPKEFSGRTIDLRGKWIVPAFTDMHLHSTFNNPGPGGVVENLTIEEVSKHLLAAGVTASLDLLADENKIWPARERQRNGKGELGAKIYAAGPMLTCTGGHGTEFGFPNRVMNSPEDARRVVRDLATKHPDIVKIAYDHLLSRPIIDKDTLFAAVAEAKKLKLKTIVHIGTWEDARAAVLAGIDIVTHLGPTEIPDDLLKLMKERGVWEVPTTTYHTDLLNIVENRSVLKSPLLPLVTSDALIAAYQNINLDESYVKEILDQQSRGREGRLKSLKKLSDSGIKLMAGTDSGDLGVIFGFSLHREMALMVKAGVPAWDALAAGTTLPKQFMKRASGIKVGDKADLVALSGNPIEDIENTQTVGLVFIEGTLVDTPPAITRATSSPK